MIAISNDDYERFLSLDKLLKEKQKEIDELKDILYKPVSNPNDS